MRWKGLVVLSVVGMALVSCGSESNSESNGGLSHARQACTKMGYKDGKAAKSTGDSTPEDVDWAESAAHYDKITDLGASAAQADPRWDRLSNALTDWSAVVENLATAADENESDEAREAARTEILELDGGAIKRAVDQECRKAQAS